MAEEESGLEKYYQCKINYNISLMRSFIEIP